MGDQLSLFNPRATGFHPHLWFAQQTTVRRKPARQAMDSGLRIRQSRHEIEFKARLPRPAPPRAVF
jgi:hypothetical protein